MNIGIVCEYNPLHLGHLRQLREIRARFPQDTGIVCAISGNFVQRGHPAILDKSLRAEAAVRCGADLVVELPVTTSLSSAEGFAAGGVQILSRLCQQISFGAEHADAEVLMSTARALLDEQFPELLRRALEAGLSFPAARQRALEAMGLPGVTHPNDILAVEYCKALLTQKAQMDIFPIQRTGNYHAQQVDAAAPSATALRQMMLTGGGWLQYVPEPARPLLAAGQIHTLCAGERAMLARLRVMTDAEFESLPYGSEGLWRKLMHACRREATLEEILAAVKSKRYTRSRLDRMVMCAFLGITAGDMAQAAPYARVLAFNDRGRQILSTQKKSGFFPNAGQSLNHPHQVLENRTGDLYGLFSLTGPEPPGLEARRRVVYIP